jgi:hypothetical protein
MSGFIKKLLKHLPRGTGENHKISQAAVPAYTVDGLYVVGR